MHSPWFVVCLLFQKAWVVPRCFGSSFAQFCSYSFNMFHSDIVFHIVLLPQTQGGHSSFWLNPGNLLVIKWLWAVHRGCVLENRVHGVAGRTQTELLQLLRHRESELAKLREERQHKARRARRPPVG